MLHPILLLILLTNYVNCKYEPNWDSLDKRPLPKWYDDAKVGIFLHWGVFSVPSFGSEWFWSNWAENNSKYVEFMKENYPPDFTYQSFAREFTAEFFNSSLWADIFKKSGAKYVVLTSKHHEGYTMWPSKYSYSWNVMDVGPKQDLLGELATAIRSKNLTFGVYHSLYEWFHPIYLADKSNNFTTNDFPHHKIIPEMKELVEKYKPSVLWSDGDWEASDVYWNSTGFLAWLYNESPVKDEIVVNDRWGIDIPCKHGDFYSCQDRYNPGTLQPHKWENAMTLDKKSWGYRRNAALSDYFTIEELLVEVVSTVSCGGNILINVGPTKDGMIAPIFEKILQDLGFWLKLNGEAIYETSPWVVQNDTLNPNVWYTYSKKNDAVYAILLTWSTNQYNQVKIGKTICKNFGYSFRINLVGNEDLGLLLWNTEDEDLYITLPNMAKVQSRWAYALKFTVGKTVNVI